MTLKIQVYSDYVCPFCYLGKGPFEEAIEGKDVEVEWMPFELRPYPAEPLDPWNDPPKKAAWDSTIAPYAKRWGVDMKLPHVSPHPYTHLAFEGYQFALERGLGKAYHDRVFRAFYGEEQNIGEPEVLTHLAGEVGLDEGEFRQALAERTYKQAHQAALRHAYEANIRAVPTFFIGDQVIQGIAGKEQLERVIEDQLNKQALEASEGPEGLSCDADGTCR
ncbi:DsbA family oxidoreductase [Gorillibacterium sp. CAU 1737]|uniref:DsbA family oxidoreductase n=1 Tax=Gorillibacterium sp. CAU 1737 TaxID=3140362 RepID=UPI003260EFF2